MSFAEMWPNAKINDGQSNLEPPGEGDFEVVVTDAAAFVSKDGKDLVKLELRVIDDGYEWTEFRNFGSQGAANAAKTTCHRLGIDTEQVQSLVDLDAELKAIRGGSFLVKVVRNGEYLNTYVEERITRKEAMSAQDAQGQRLAPVPATAIDDNDIPF